MRPISSSFAESFMVTAVVGSIPLLLSFVGAGTHGTLDNASGVATVLAAAELLAADASVGILITDAEELALAGARAWSVGRQPRIALNCDSVDDDGPLVVMHNAPAPERLLLAMAGVAREAGEPLRTMRLIPGILTDHVALASAGWTTLTLSRGTARTLRRIHTSHDTLATMRGDGIAGAARVLAKTAAELS
jgi:Zn-dependent M28 family amino/carboxypeptidase